jgi:hypothetical protein
VEVERKCPFFLELLSYVGEGGTLLRFRVPATLNKALKIRRYLGKHLFLRLVGLRKEGREGGREGGRKEGRKKGRAFKGRKEGREEGNLKEGRKGGRKET